MHSNTLADGSPDSLLGQKTVRLSRGAVLPVNSSLKLGFSVVAFMSDKILERGHRNAGLRMCLAKRIPETGPKTKEPVREDEPAIFR